MTTGTLPLSKRLIVLIPFFLFQALSSRQLITGVLMLNTELRLRMVDSYLFGVVWQHSGLVEGRVFLRLLLRHSELVNLLLVDLGST